MRRFQKNNTGDHMAFSKVLVANRGEIAVRVMQTAKEMGYKTVAVYSEADQYARHVQVADEAVFIGESKVSESYLSITKIIEACKKTGADAVHPGYGFLSENADFAERVEKSGFVFIGPRSETIRLMGDKVSAKNAMKSAGVPCVPGSEGALPEDLDEIRKIGEVESEILFVSSEPFGWITVSLILPGGTGVVEKKSWDLSLSSDSPITKNKFVSHCLCLKIFL